jgi:peptidoglycan-N-acetylglucosamine deacetylase
MLIETLGGAAAALGIMTWSVRSPRSSLVAPSVDRGVRDRRSIALSFDDGPSESTPRVLELLERRGISATFFECGANVRRLPEVARAVQAAGHEIGNHSDSHCLLPLRSPAFIFRELAAAQDTIAETTGARPRLFRAPYGARWFGLRSAQRRLELRGVMWTVIGLDWKWPADRVARRLLHRAGNGAIICLHDGRRTAARPDISATIQALEMVIPRWIESGYHFETVSQILCPTTN